MTDQNQKKQNEGKGGVNPVVAVVTGAIVGAGVAVAGAVALNDKKNREKVKKVLTNAKDQAVEYVEKMQKEMKEEKGIVEKELSKGKKKAKKAMR